MSTPDARRTRIVRVRLVGRRWKASFLRALFQGIEETVGGDVEVRVTSFLAANARMPLTDVDIFVEPTAQVRGKLYRLVLDALLAHGYPAKRLLTVKEAEAVVPAEGVAGEG